MDLDPKLELPQLKGKPGSGDSITYSFSSLPSEAAPGHQQIQGTIRIGIANDVASGIVQVFCAGKQVITHVESVSTVGKPQSLDELAVAGIDLEIVEPHKNWTVSVATDEAALDLNFSASGPPYVIGSKLPIAKLGGSRGYEQPCTVAGVLRLGEQRFQIAGLGQRGHQWGSQPKEPIVLSRTVCAWFENGASINAIALRKESVSVHSDEFSFAAVIAPDDEGQLESITLNEARISTTTDATGSPINATLEIRDEESDGLWICTGEASCSSVMQLGPMELHSTFFSWRLDGAAGAGRYDILRRPEPAQPAN